MNLKYIDDGTRSFFLSHDDRRNGIHIRRHCPWNFVLLYLCAAAVHRTASSNKNYHRKSSIVILHLVDV